MRIFLCCLMLGLTFLKYGSELLGDDFASSAPTPYSQRQGFYRLLNGTEGCPESLVWQEQCSGFSLTARTDLGVIEFCHINRGPKTTRNEFGKFWIKSSYRDQYVHRLEKSLFTSQSLLISEDTVILDLKKEQFQLEHSRYGRGFSCLYSK